ncbi:MAG TPA: PRC-barrel domain-containing protein [Propionibacteriaceae bacterium]|nr:PRC-barrel domain-containing protein [Propionibacteriaceae bacterium]
MVKSTSVFVSRLRGLPVLDVSGDSVGRVRDVVISLRTLARAPRVKGLVVDIFGRRRIFVPMIRVHSISASQVTISAQVDTRQFRRWESEMLVIADLFDRTVERPGGPGVIYDIAMGPARAREWEITDAAIREGGSMSRFRLRTGGNTVIVPWNEVPALVLSAERTTDTVVARMADMKPADVARELHDMDPERLADVVHALDDTQLAGALEELPSDEQVQVITTLDNERAADILEEMDPDDAADLIGELPKDVAEDLLQRMEPEDAQDVRNLLLYEDYTAGGMMTPEPVILPPDATVADALARVRDEELTPALASMVFVCRAPLDTPSGRFLGAVHTQRLLREPPSFMVSRLIDTGLEPMSPESGIADVSRYFATYNLVVAPVVNSDQQLVGAVTVDDLLDHMLPEDWRGSQMDGVEPREVSGG